jgi:hypothetical protein
VCLLSSLGVGACAVHLVPSTGITRYYSCSECVSKENLSNLLNLCTVATHLTMDRLSWQAACNGVSLRCHSEIFGVCNAMKTIRTCCNRRTRPRQYNGHRRFTHCAPRDRSLNYLYLGAGLAVWLVKRVSPVSNQFIGTDESRGNNLGL